MAREYALVAETNREGQPDITTWILTREGDELTAYPFESAGTALQVILLDGLGEMTEATEDFYATVKDRTRWFDDDMSEAESDEGPFPYLAWNMLPGRG